MFKMSISSKYHTYVKFITSIDGILITDGAAGLHDGGDAGLMSQLHTVVEGEEGIGGEHGTMEVEAKGMGFLDGLAQRIDP